MVIHRSIAGGAENLFAHRNKTCRQLVEEAELLALADIDEPLHISALCLALAVSERTLRKAFHQIHGLPPCRHLRMLRLSRARRALLSADCELTTVTEIATRFGFVELGRFSVEYRKLFGESPSQTLSRASLPTTPAQPAQRAVVHQDRIGF
jgi:transcriptional regulator GlxA family with amidase domain